MSALTAGLLIIGMGVSAGLYGISTAQTFYYYRTYVNDPLSTRILTGCVWALNTLHLGLVIHIPWYYLIDGAGGINDSKIVWSWPASVIVTVLVSLPVYAFYARRIRVLGGQLWICYGVVLLGLTHFTLGIVFSARLMASGEITALTSPSNLGLTYAALAVGTATDVSVAFIMCWLLARSRTGYYTKTDGVVSVIMVYTINSGMIIAICVVATLLSNLIAPTTQFELFFLFLLPDLYANAYLGSLNNRNAIRAQLAHPTVDLESSNPLHDIQLPPLTPSAIVHIQRTKELRTDDLAMGFEDDENVLDLQTKNSVNGQI